MTKQFAEIDSENRVIQVLEVDAADVDNYGGDQSQTAVDYVSSYLSLSSPKNRWVQTCKDRSFRKRFAAIGGTYDSEKDAFISPKPYDNFIFNSETLDWEPPIPYPTTEIPGIDWDPINNKWRAFVINPKETDPPILFWDENALVWKS